MEQKRSKTRNLTGSTIRRLRVSHSFTQEMLSARCNILGCNLTRGTLAKIEAGIRGVTDNELLAIASSLHVKVDLLYPKNALKSLRDTIL
ncbi:MAG: helix-turn-helix transcriptional regulator [Verrucomicrobiota bacterium]